METTKIEYEISTDFDPKEKTAQRNLTLFVQELERIVTGGKENTNLNHGMTPAEYDRFVSDMWIGIILTMLMVLIVFALCLWYMYHKFQQWKRHYDDRARLRNTTANGISNDLECLPNYTLVSGLPTYDDALEQLRLRSTNHLLINHQTIMKIFGSIKEKPKKQKPDIPVPSYEDSMRSQLHESSRTHERPPTTGSVVQHRFKCTIVLPPSPPNTSEQNWLSDHVESSSSQNPLFLSHSLGSLNIIKEIHKSRPEIKWAHRSTSLCLDREIPTNDHHEHRGSLY